MSAVADRTFDRGYAIESTCHAADKVAAFHRDLPDPEIWWPLLGPGNVHDGHVRLRQRSATAPSRRELMRGIALKEIATFGEVNRALETAGFEVIEGGDLAELTITGPGHATWVSADGNPSRAARQRSPPDSAEQQGDAMGSQDVRIPRCVPEGLGGDDRGSWIGPRTPMSRGERRGSSRRSTVSWRLEACGLGPGRSRPR